MKSLFIALLLLSSTVSADEIVVNIASYHINSVYDFNENNIGLGYRDTSRNIEVGFFRNSYYKTDSEFANGFGYSVYIKGSGYSKLVNEYLMLNVDFGLSIYGRDGTLPFIPIVQPMLMFKPLKDININMGYMPMFAEVERKDLDNTTKKSVMYGLLTLSVSYSF